MIEKAEEPTVLIVEDDNTMRRLLNQALEQAGFSCVSASSGREALELVRKHGMPQIALVDIDLSYGMSGLEFQLILKAMDSTVHIIIVSANKNIELIIDCLNFSASDYITKPFSMDELVARVRNIFRSNRHEPTHSAEEIYNYIYMRGNTLHLQQSESLSASTHNSMLTQNVARHDDSVFIQDDIDLFMSGLLHQLNNLIAPIRILVQQAKHNTKDPRKDIEKIESQATRAVNMLKRLQAPTILWQSEIVNLTETIQEALILILFPKQIQVKLDIADNANYVQANQEALLRVLENLFLNAIQAMNNHGTLQISSNQINKQWIGLRITDTGSGIPSDVQERLFESFFTTKKHAGGQGVGLWVSKRLIDRIDGKLSLEKSVLNEGTTFLIKLRAATENIKEENSDES